MPLNSHKYCHTKPSILEIAFFFPPDIIFPGSTHADGGRSSALILTDE